MEPIRGAWMLICLLPLHGLPRLGIAQDDSQRLIVELARKLGSDQIEEREEATRQLKVFGDQARVHLEAVARGQQPEAAGRALHLLKIFAIMRRLTPNLMK